MGRCLHVGDRGEAAPHGVLGDSPRQHELQQVIRAARLGADARQLEAAERLPVDQGAGDLAVDVQVADAELALDPRDVAPGCASTGRRSGRRRCRWRSPGRASRSRALRTASTGPKISSWAMTAVGGTSAKMCGADVVALLGQRRRRRRRKPSRPSRLPCSMVVEDAALGLGVDHRADACSRDPRPAPTFRLRVASTSRARKAS